MIRCVAYYGDVGDELPRDEIERIGVGTKVRNAALGITGCLFHFGGHFVQVLEGGVDDVARLYGTIVSDERHPDVIGLADHIVQARAFSNWSIRFVHRDPHPAAGASGLPGIAGETASSHSISLLAGKLDRRISSHLRVMPQQARAMKTVDRLLDAAGRMLSRESGFDRLTLERAAAEAGVTQQSAYRYFADIDDLIRMALRRMQAGWHARFVDFMTRQTFASEAEVASAAVVFIAETYESQIGASARLKRELLRRYHDIEYDAAWIVSDAICESIAAGEQAVRIGIAEMASGLTALWAVAKLLALRDSEQLGRPPIRHMMIAVFLAALEGPARPDPDGLARLA